MKQDESRLNLPRFDVLPGAIALDIDGTLLDSKSQFSARNARAIQKCLARGIPVIIATSRPKRSVRKLLGYEIMNACSLVMQNGAIGIGRTPLSGRIKEIIPKKTLLELIKKVREMEPEIRITLELEGEAFGTNNPRGPESLWQVNSATQDMQLTLEEALEGEPTKIAIGGLNRDITHIGDMILSRYGDAISLAGEAGKTFFNITAKSATKSNTLRRLLQTQNIPLSNVVALGDDLPDFDMLSNCGIAIAMGNAVPEIKAICKYFTLSNNEDGAAVALEKILSTKS